MKSTLSMCMKACMSRSLQQPIYILQVQLEIATTMSASKHSITVFSRHSDSKKIYKYVCLIAISNAYSGLQYVKAVVFGVIPLWF